VQAELGVLRAAAGMGRKLDPAPSYFVLRALAFLHCSVRVPAQKPSCLFVRSRPGDEAGATHQIDSYANATTEFDPTY
jgi:hypothetical protein